MFMLMASHCLRDSNLQQQPLRHPLTPLLPLKRLPRMTTQYQGQISLKDIAELAGVGRSAVSNWRKRNSDFPAPVEGSPERRPLFHFSQMISWLESQDLLPNNWKANLTEPLVSSAISPLAIG